MLVVEGRVLVVVERARSNKDSVTMDRDTAASAEQK